MAFDNYPSGFPKHFVDSSQFLGAHVFPCPHRSLAPMANSEKEMAKHMASESEISDTETTYVESQNTETSLGSSEDKRSGRSSILSTVVILLVELCEALTYYTLAGTQKVYLQNQLDRSPSTSAAMNSVFSIWDCSFRARFDIFRTFFLVESQHERIPIPVIFPLLDHFGDFQASSGLSDEKDLHH